MNFFHQRDIMLSHEGKVGPSPRPSTSSGQAQGHFAANRVRAGSLEQEQGTIVLSMSALFASKWLLKRNVLRATKAIIPIKWKNLVNKKSKNSAQSFHQYPTKHIIHKAIEWQGVLDEGLAESLNDV